MSEAQGPAASTFLKSIRDWRPLWRRKLTNRSASGVLPGQEQAGNNRPGSSSLPEHQVLQFGGVQQYSGYPGQPYGGYPGTFGQHMSWAGGPQHWNGWTSHGNVPVAAFPKQLEESVTSFAIGSYQGLNGVAVTLKPETFLNLSPEQQMGLIGIGSTPVHDARRLPPSPRVPHPSSARATSVTDSVAPTVIEELEPDTPPSIEERRAPERPHSVAGEQQPVCLECNRQITISILPQQCVDVSLCGPCYDSAVRQCAV